MINRRRFLEGCGRCAVSWPIALSPLGALLARGDASAQGGPPGQPGAVAADVDRWTRSVCDLCGLGEPVFLRTTGGTLAAVKGIPQSRTGFGRLCPRARALVEAARTEDRATQPLVRRDPATKGTLEGLEPASWEEALAAVAAGVGAVRDRIGPEGVAIVASDAETCETYGELARLARTAFGTDHVDTPARLDALHAYDACEAVFGVAANPSTVEDVDAAKLVLLIGGEVADSHPGLYTRVLDVRRTNRAKVVLVDSRRALAASLADVHVRARPGTEVAVVNALAAALAASGDLEAGVGAPWTSWLRGAGAAGLSAAGVRREEIAQAAVLWREARNVVTLVGPVALGTYSGGALARAVAQLHRAAGQWGTVGKGCLLLPRGGNTTGVVAAGIRPGRLPAGGRPTVADDRAKVATAWGVSADALPRSPGLSVLEWPIAVREDRLGAIVALRANIAAEFPDAGAWREALTRAFTVAATTHVPTETTVFADVVLPLALVAGESTGTMMTLDRRVQSLEAAAAPPGEARDAERILADVAAAVTATAPPSPPPPEAPTGWERWQELARGTPFAADGITPARLRTELDVAWPCTAEDQPGTVRLDAASVTAVSIGAPVWIPTPLPSRPAVPSAEPVLLLVTGPLSEHERSRVRTGRTAELHYEAPTPRLEMHPEDARTLSLPDGEWVTVSTETGSATARLWITDRVMPGVVFLPEHYGFLSDLQGGSATQGEPEGLAALVVAAATDRSTNVPVGLPARVNVRKARRRDMRQRGIG